MDNFKQWLTAQYYEMARAYRYNLEIEIRNTKRTFGTITPDVREMLVKGLKSIPTPIMERWEGDRKKTMDIYYATPKPDFERILLETLKTI